jgi:DNA-binding NtrC family response regulator
MGKHARILIVDDDESIRTVLAAILEEKGYAVATAETGKQGIQKSHDGFYSLALVDICLPDMVGTKVLPCLKETMPRMRKIIITGYPSLQNAVEALNEGADAYVMKPLDMEKVLQTIEEQLKKQEEEKSYSQEKVTEFIETRVKELEGQKVPTRKTL